MEYDIRPDIAPPDSQTIEKLKCMSRKQRRQFKKSAAYQKYVKPCLLREKEFKKQKRKEWLWNKGFLILNTFLALIAAITGVVSLILQLL